MNILLALGLVYVPPAIKKARLRELFEATADAFQCQPPPYDGLSYRQSLEEYARFTRDKAEEAIKLGKEMEVKPRLYQNASIMARNIKKSLHINVPADVMQAGEVIYRILNIDFKGSIDGSIIIRRCFFSSYYSGDVCRVISSLDEGLMEELSGGSFRFSQRITEGEECCRARLISKEGQD